MERQIELRLGKRRYTLLYSVRVMLDAMQKYGSETAMLDALKQPGAAAADAMGWLFCREAEEGNLLRAAKGQPERELPDPDTLLLEISQADFLRLQKAAMNAFVAGHRREVEDEEEEIDEGLAELEKKTEPERRKPGLSAPWRR